MWWRSGQRRRGRSDDSAGWTSSSRHGAATDVEEPPWHRGRRQEAAMALTVEGLAAAAASRQPCWSSWVFAGGGEPNVGCFYEEDECFCDIHSGEFLGSLLDCLMG